MSFDQFLKGMMDCTFQYGSCPDMYTFLPNLIQTFFCQILKKTAIFGMYVDNFVITSQRFLLGICEVVLIMNTEEEIEQTLKDYKLNQNGFENATPWLEARGSKQNTYQASGQLC